VTPDKRTLAELGASPQDQVATVGAAVAARYLSVI